MPHFFLDSDVIIDLFRGDKKTSLLIEKITKDEPPSCSSLTLLEVKRGARISEKKMVDKFFDDVYVYPVDREVAQKASEITIEWQKKGKALQLVDACIAATCVIHDLTLVTYNKRDYPMKEVDIL